MNIIRVGQVGNLSTATSIAIHVEQHRNLPSNSLANRDWKERHETIQASRPLPQ
jgi:hypothetical protein